MSNRKIEVTNSEGLHELYVDDITHIDSDKGYSVIHYKGSEYRIRKRLKEIENKFPEDFIRTHSQTLVNIHKIIEINEDIDPVGTTLVGVDYPVKTSASRVSDIKQRLGIDDFKDESSKEIRQNWLYAYLEENRVISLDNSSIASEFAETFNLKTGRTTYGIIKCMTMNNDLLHLHKKGKVKKIRKRTSFEEVMKGHPPYTLVYKIDDD